MNDRIAPESRTTNLPHPKELVGLKPDFLLKEWVAELPNSIKTQGGLLDTELKDALKSVSIEKTEHLENIEFVRRRLPIRNEREVGSAVTVTGKRDSRRVPSYEKAKYEKAKQIGVEEMRAVETAAAAERKALMEKFNIEEDRRNSILDAAHDAEIRAAAEENARMLTAQRKNEYKSSLADTLNLCAMSAMCSTVDADRQLVDYFNKSLREKQFGVDQENRGQAGMGLGGTEGFRGSFRRPQPEDLKWKQVTVELIPAVERKNVTEVRAIRGAVETLSQETDNAIEKIDDDQMDKEDELQKMLEH
ncbi:unnamed protein product [Caenorhabditis sp. 36 PRJEB53466]|nr:unnamed protein product [Caenorhabditis sp. 36 PRJEB53466]